MVDTIKKSLEFMIKQNFIVRYIFLSLLGTLGGATYVGKLSEYATYYYAWSNGFRVPAEGVPYLNLTVFGASFSIIILAIIAFTAIYFFGKLIYNYIQNDIILKGATSILQVLVKDKKKSTVILFCIVIALFLSVIVFTLPYLSFVVTISRWIIVPLVFFVTFITLMVLWNRKTLFILAVVISFSFAVITPSILFNASLYSNLLGALGYGGGINITIESGKKNYINNKLLLRTSKYFILIKNNKIIEIPSNKIDRIIYD